MLVLAVAFAGLAIYVAAQAAYALITADHPEPSPLGIGWTAATFVAMVALAIAKGRTGRRLGNGVSLTECRVTLIDAYLAGAVLAGLVLNALAGLWWADPVAGVVVVFCAVRESREAWSRARSPSKTA